MRETTLDLAVSDVAVSGLTMEAGVERAEIVRRITVARAQADALWEVARATRGRKRSEALRDAGLCDRYVGGLEAALGEYDRTHPMADTDPAPEGASPDTETLYRNFTETLTETE